MSAMLAALPEIFRYVDIPEMMHKKVKEWMTIPDTSIEIPMLTYCCEQWQNGE